jgi:hypothetical protein
MRRHRIALVRAVAALLVALVPASSFASSCETRPFGNGTQTTCQYDDGTTGTFTTRPFGNGTQTTGSDTNGDTYTATTRPFGNGTQTTGGWNNCAAWMNC